ncbi:MAG: hypothetical protein H0X35_11175 [Pseudonocardiales bacterium]|nr:hypothetical protein [Pseudonocardiales bacterium]
MPECTGELACVTPWPTVVQCAVLSSVVDPGASKKLLFAVRVEIEKSDAWLWSVRNTAFSPAARAFFAKIPRSGRPSALTVL